MAGVDRRRLIERSSSRLADEIYERTRAAITEINKAAAASGRVGGQSTLNAIERRCIDGYRELCVAVLDKVQFEDGDGALELTEDIRNSLLNTEANRFSNLAADVMVGKRVNLSAHMGDNFSVKRYRVSEEVGRELRDVQANVVEEFQLAVTRQAPQRRQQIHVGVFVDPERIEALRAKTSVAWDFTRLAVLCEEINTCWLYGAHHAVAMLTRAIIDHVPPIFGQLNFSGVANQYRGGRSFGELMKQLEKTAKAIADGHLHNQIRHREALPTATQVDCRQAIDALLAEVIRIAP